MSDLHIVDQGESRERSLDYISSVASEYRAVQNGKWAVMEVISG